MAVKSNFASGDVLNASDVNTYLTNGGLVYITQTLVTSGTSSSISFNNVFTSTYDNYRIIFDSWQPSTAGTDLVFRLRNSGTDRTGGNYNSIVTGIYQNSTSTNFTQANGSYLFLGLYNSLNTDPYATASIDVYNPQRNDRTFFTGLSAFYNGQLGSRTLAGVYWVADQNDGFTLLPTAGNITTLRVRVYGYRQA